MHDGNIAVMLPCVFVAVMFRRWVDRNKTSAAAEVQLDNAHTKLSQQLKKM